MRVGAGDILLLREVTNRFFDINGFNHICFCEEFEKENTHS